MSDVPYDSPEVTDGLVHLKRRFEDHWHEWVNPDSSDGSPVFNDPVCRICGMHPDYEGIPAVLIAAAPDPVYTAARAAIAAYRARPWSGLAVSGAMLALEAALAEADGSA